MMRMLVRPILLVAAVVGLASTPALAQRSVAGVDEEDDEDGEPPSDARKNNKPKDDGKAADGKKKADKKKADEKKADEKKADEKKADEKKADAAKAKKGDKAAAPVDVLEETADEKRQRAAEGEARQKAEDAAAAADAKQAAEKAKLLEEKKANAEKRRAESREQRLAAARKARALVREEGAYRVGVAIEPGALQKEQLVEVRLDIGRKLEVADPRFGSREPLKNLSLIATIIEPSGKKTARQQFVVHSLGAPGLYGFHMTPPRDGVVQVQVAGDVGDRTLDFSFPLHVGVWPPPDFDDEDQKLSNADQKGG